MNNPISRTFSAPFGLIHVLVFATLSGASALGADRAGVIKDAERPGHPQQNKEVQGTLSQVRFEGLKAVNEQALRSQMKTKTGGGFSEETIASDIRVIEKQLQDTGHPYAKVVEVRRMPKDGNKTDLEFVLNEGERFTISKVVIKGNRVFGEASLQPLPLIKAGDRYSGTLVTESGTLLGDYYGSRGYADAYVECSVADQGNHTAKVSFQITEGEKSFVGLINITGNTLTPDKLILREIHLSPGDLLDRVSLDKTRETLMKSGRFSVVDILKIPTPKPGIKDIDIQVVEQ